MDIFTSRSSISLPPIEIPSTDVSRILASLTDSNLIGKGAAGAVYKIHYYGQSAVAKIPVSNTTKNNIQKEMLTYRHLCGIFNKCSCDHNIVQMLGYDTAHDLMILEYFDGSDLTKYVGYPMTSITFYTHRLLPYKSPEEIKGADFNSLGKYLKLKAPEEIIYKLFDEIYTGLVCLHKVGILHGDLELKNILMRSSGKIGIADFGAAQIIGMNRTYSDFSGFYAGFSRDTSTFGPMMGDFLDANNIAPYQYRLDNGAVDNVPILNAITDIKLSDAFFLATSFRDIIIFVSVIYYINNHPAEATTLIKQATIMYNEIIEAEVPEDKQEAYNFYEHMIPGRVSEIKEPIIPTPHLSDLIKYFRAVITEIFLGYESTDMMETESVHTYILRKFGETDYKTVVASLVDELRYGVSLNNFFLFSQVYRLQK